jgi:hypothetical protein
MNFDPRYENRAHDYIREAGQQNVSRRGAIPEADFYSGGLLTSTRRDVKFNHVPAIEIMAGLPWVVVELTRRSSTETARLRSEYTDMVRQTGFRDKLKQAFFKKAQKECCRVQEHVRRGRHQLTKEQILQAYGGYDLHHRIPLSLGGTNHLDNLTFIPRAVHKRVHDEINRASRHVEIGDSALIAIPYPVGIIPLGKNQRLNYKKTKHYHPA